MQKKLAFLKKMRYLILQTEQGSGYGLDNRTKAFRDGRLFSMYKGV